jgi:hypothetical protein
MIARSAIGLALVAIVTSAGCGPSSPSGPVDASAPHDGSAGHVDAAHPDSNIDSGAVFDFGCGGNTACLTTQVCCAMPGATTTFACVAPGACSAADKISCDGPDECGGTKPVCCGVDVPDGTGNYPTCGVASLGTSCTSAAACPTNLGQSCSDTTKVQICHINSECTDPNNNQCCTFMSGGAQLTFCTDATTAALGGATCHPQ